MKNENIIVQVSRICRFHMLETGSDTFLISVTIKNVFFLICITKRGERSLRNIPCSHLLVTFLYIDGQHMLNFAAEDNEYFI